MVPVYLVPQYLRYRRYRSQFGSTDCVYHQACAAVAHPRGCWLTVPIEASRRLYRIFSILHSGQQKEWGSAPRLSSSSNS